LRKPAKARPESGAADCPFAAKTAANRTRRKTIGALQFVFVIVAYSGKITTDFAKNAIANYICGYYFPAQIRTTRTPRRFCLRPAARRHGRSDRVLPTHLPFFPQL
jgi:hypothetical protein